MRLGHLAAVHLGLRLGDDPVDLFGLGFCKVACDCRVDGAADFAEVAEVQARRDALVVDDVGDAGLLGLVEQLDGPAKNRLARRRAGKVEMEFVSCHFAVLPVGNRDIRLF